MSPTAALLLSDAMTHPPLKQSNPSRARPSHAPGTLNPTFSLEVMAETVHYNDWIYELMRPFLGSRMLELGAGVGNLTPYFVREGRTVTAIDIDENLLEQHRTNVPPSPRLTVVSTTLQELAADQRNHGAFDSVVSSNVLEHIPDGVDREVVRSMFIVLRSGGHAVHWVPALQGIFGSIDAAFGHHRRYDRNSGRALFVEAGFRIVSCEYWNMPGVIGWWLHGRVLKRRSLSRGSALAFDRFVVLLLIPAIPSRSGWAETVFSQHLGYPP